MIKNLLENIKSKNPLIKSEPEIYDNLSLLNFNDTVLAWATTDFFYCCRNSREVSREINKNTIYFSVFQTIFDLYKYLFYL